jgi:dTDP-4-dehydrorhamnose reductase
LRHLYRGRLIHISTDFIFDGRDGPYLERDRPNPISIYGWSKLGGELAVGGQPETLIVRTTILFDGQHRNFVTSILKQLRKGEPVDLYGWWLAGSPTYVPHLVEGLVYCAENWTMEKVLNIAGNRVVTRLELAQCVAREFGYSPDQIHRVDALAPSGIQVAPRPIQAGLIVDKAIEMEVPIRDPILGLRKIKEKS